MLIFFALSSTEYDFINKLFKSEHVRLYNISLGILKNKADAEESLSQTFLSIIQHSEKICSMPDDSVQAYCVVIAKHAAFNIIRQNKKLTLVDEYENLSDEKSISTWEDMLQMSGTDSLSDAIKQLPEQDRHIIHLKFTKDMTYKEISGLYGITEEAAKKRGQRALEKLRQLYIKGEKNELFS